MEVYPYTDTKLICIFSHESVTEYLGSRTPLFGRTTPKGDNSVKKKIVLSLKGRNFVKINSSSIQKPHTHLQYVRNAFAKFEKHPSKTVREVHYRNSIPYKAKNA